MDNDKRLRTAAKVLSTLTIAGMLLGAFLAPNIPIDKEAILFIFFGAPFLWVIWAFTYYVLLIAIWGIAIGVGAIIGFVSVIIGAPVYYLLRSLRPFFSGLTPYLSDRLQELLGIYREAAHLKAARVEGIQRLESAELPTHLSKEPPSMIFEGNSLLRRLLLLTPIILLITWSFDLTTAKWSIGGGLLALVIRALLSLRNLSATAFTWMNDALGAPIKTKQGQVFSLPSSGRFLARQVGFGGEMTVTATIPGIDQIAHDFELDTSQLAVTVTAPPVRALILWLLALKFKTTKTGIKGTIHLDRPDSMRILSDVIVGLNGILSLIPRIPTEPVKQAFFYLKESSGLDQAQILTQCTELAPKKVSYAVLKKWAEFGEGFTRVTAADALPKPDAIVSFEHIAGTTDEAIEVRGYALDNLLDIDSERGNRLLVRQIQAGESDLVLALIEQDRLDKLDRHFKKRLIPLTLSDGAGLVALLLVSALGEGVPMAVLIEWLEIPKTLTQQHLALLNRILEMTDQQVGRIEAARDKLEQMIGTQRGGLALTTEAGGGLSLIEG